MCCCSLWQACRRTPTPRRQKSRATAPLPTRMASTLTHARACSWRTRTFRWRTTPSVSSQASTGSAGATLSLLILQGIDPSLLTLQGMTPPSLLILQGMALLPFCSCRTYGRPTRDVVVRRCEIANGAGPTIGSEMSGSVFNVTFEDIIMGSEEVGITLKTARGPSGAKRRLVPCSAHS